MRARSASGSVLGTQFDDFLLAPVLKERNGPLSVLSALARLGVDPWHTAATLAKLPPPAAVRELASMFAGLPEGPANRDAVAARVVAFLPGQTSARASPPGSTAPTAGHANGQHLHFAIVCVVSMLIGLIAQGFVMSHQEGTRGPTAQSAAVRKTVVSPR
jgi:hypothetical protein